MNSRTFSVAVLLILAAAAFLRGAWLTADPPVRRAVGIVWHDEGAWVHNARNQVLWGTWRTDEWNPVFIAPVFTALEYASFATLGVGTWQARAVPAVSGLVAVVALMIGLHVLGGRRAAVIGGALLASNYAFVMWNRAALMESTMTACMVVAWMAWAVWRRDSTPHRDPAARHRLIRQAAFAAVGLAAGAALVGLLFVLPHWSDYQFYNWQMSVTRKPTYTLGAFVDRATWLPIVQGLFSRMPIELVAGLTGLTALAIGWRWARPAERLLVFWILFGLAELVVHDSGNERRYVMFIPAIIALASLLLARSSALFAPGRHMKRTTAVAVVALVLPLAYLAIGSLLRPFLMEDIDAGQLRLPVRLSAAGALVVTTLVAWRGARLLHWAGRRAIPLRVVAGLVMTAVVWNGMQWVDWAATRTTVNHDASIALGAAVPDGALVQGKLANGMALENRIRPLFVGNTFGNYADRLQRDDARYILTYDLPRIGYESSDGSGLIQGILDHYPSRRVVATFPVDETRMEDRAVLIDKFPDDSPAHARD